MKALLIADDDIVIEKIKASLTDEGYDVITYRWLIKAMDNVEEIAPEVIVISASSYPRHWKTLVQFVQSGIGGVIPKVVLYAEREFNDDDLRKSFVFPDRLMKNIDFTDVSFDNFDFRGFDAIGFYGITINTDSIYNKDLSYSILRGVSIIGSIDGINIEGTDFSGCVFYNNKVKGKK